MFEMRYFHSTPNSALAVVAPISPDSKPRQNRRKKRISGELFHMRCFQVASNHDSVVYRWRRTLSLNNPEVFMSEGGPTIKCGIEITRPHPIVELNISSAHHGAKSQLKLAAEKNRLLSPKVSDNAS
jgi:hypothetical protein